MQLRNLVNCNKKQTGNTGSDEPRPVITKLKCYSSDFGCQNTIYQQRRTKSANPNSIRETCRKGREDENLEHLANKTHQGGRNEDHGEESRGARREGIKVKQPQEERVTRKQVCANGVGRNRKQEKMPAQRRAKGVHRPDSLT